MVRSSELNSHSSRQSGRKFSCVVSKPGKVTRFVQGVISSKALLLGFIPSRPSKFSLTSVSVVYFHSLTRQILQLKTSFISDMYVWLYVISFREHLHVY